MAVKRRVSWISQQRVDVPDMRALESAASNDFDELVKALFTGEEEGYILRGFELSMAGAIGGASSALQMFVAEAAVLHTRSSQSGAYLVVPAGTPPEPLNSATNTIVDGAFAPNAINYVGLEYERFIDDTTSAQVYIWNPTTDSETTKVAPRAQILRYRIKITASTWATNVLPICTVTTDAGNNVTDIGDSRRDFFRLGTAGRSTANPFYVYPWTAQSEGRVENPPSSNSNAVNPFHGGDKMLGTFKDWMDAVMSQILEIKGTTYWYSLGTSGSLASLRQDLGNTISTGAGIISHSADTAGLINWDEDIHFKVVGSRLDYVLLANPSSIDITLNDNQVAYVNLVRGVLVTPNLIFTNGSAIITSVGNVAWTAPLAAGDWVKAGADTDAGYYKIQTVDSLSQITLTENFGGTSTGAAGAKAKYAFGSYSTSPAPSTGRHIFIADREDVPEGENIFWFLLRADNGGVIPKVYVRFIGSELELGESEEIDDGVSRQLLQYIGSPLESASKPQYASALNPGSLPEKTTITTGDATTMVSNQYFFINSSADSRRYAVWVNKDGTGVQPNAPFVNAYVEWIISTGQTATQTAQALATVLASTDDEDFTTVAGIAQVLVTNKSAGTCADAVNFNVGAPFAVTVTQQGTGSGNFAINDGDSLTLAIKKLDEAIREISSLLDEPGYCEYVDIVASGGVPPASIDVPVISGDLIQLPDNSRLGNLPQKYTVGQGVLELDLNGIELAYGRDFNEVGAAGTASDQIEILRSLFAGDSLGFKILVQGGPGGGGGVGVQGPPGPMGVPGNDAIGGPIAISTKIVDYTVMTSDNMLRADASSGTITFSLPPAASAVGNVFFLKKVDASANPMIVEADGSELIDGFNTQQTTVQYESFTIVSNGTGWDIF